jgi:hypothetical protein
LYCVYQGVIASNYDRGIPFSIEQGPRPPKVGTRRSTAMQLAAATRSTSKRRRPVARAPGGDIDRLPVVAVVDDEDAVREAMEGLLRSAGFEAEGFGSAEAFLSCRRRTRFSCMDPRH